MAFTILFFGACALLMGRKALLNERGLVISGLIHLEPGEATIFYWCIAAMGAGFVAIGVPGLFAALFSSQHVTLTTTEISAPRSGFSRRVTVVRLADIFDLSTLVINKQRFLEIVHTDGKLTIVESLLPDKAAFEELCAAIANLVPDSVRE